MSWVNACHDERLFDRHKPFHLLNDAAHSSRAKLVCTRVGAGDGVVWMPTPPHRVRTRDSSGPNAEFRRAPSLVAFVAFVVNTRRMSVTRAEVFDLEERDRAVVASVDSDHLSVSVRVGDETVVLPADANRAVRSLLRDLASGVPVHVIPADAELTTQQAADLLGLSRTYVVRLIDQGSLSAHMAGTHRRLLASDVLAYRERRASKLAALGELTEADEELGLSY